MGGLGFGQELGLWRVGVGVETRVEDGEDWGFGRNKGWGELALGLKLGLRIWRVEDMEGWGLGGN